MCRSLKSKITPYCLILILSLSTIISNAQVTEKTKTTKIQISPEIVVKNYVTQIKELNLPLEKKKKLSELIDLVNQEFNKNSAVVTDLLTQISQKNNKDVDKNLLKEKNTAEAIYHKWVVYRIALKPNYDLFIEKTDKYHCDVISEEIWREYTPIAPQDEKVELDPYTKKAVAASIEIAEELCKFAAEF